MLGHHAWANAELLDTLARLDPVAHAAESAAARRLMGHIALVGRIFQAHLSGRDHGLVSDMPEATPDLAALVAETAAVDHWYLSYVAGLTRAALDEAIAFGFTDGQRGRMSRAEMLAHVALHGGYHRGEIGRLVGGLGVPLPWDTFAVYLHRHEPRRRLAP
jgi:uncharacterized damage-inducible protein DinB